MNRSLRALGLLGLVALGVWYWSGGSRMTAADSSETVSAPVVHENLRVYFVYGSDAVNGAPLLSLQEALERGLAVVHETGNVNTLAIENKSPDCDLFIQSGEIVKGGQQDRMIATDMLVPPGAGRVSLPAHCVEQGRWTNRGTEDAKRFAKSDNFAAGKDLKLANANGQQPAVWQQVSENQAKLSGNLKQTVNGTASPTSFQLTLEAPAVTAKVAEYENALREAGKERNNIVGVVFVVNGQITGAEVYGSNALFRKAWPKLLNAAAVEAVAEGADKQATAPPTPRGVERFLARGADPELAPAARTQSDPLELLAALVNDNVGMTSAGGRGTRVQSRESFQTEGRLPERVQTEGFVMQTQTRALESGRARGEAGPAVNTVRDVQAQNAAINASIPIIGNGSAGGIAQPQPPAPATGNNGGGRVIIAGNEVTLDRVVMNQLSVQAQPAAPASADGNRLNSNRTENRSTLMIESRDPARQNAVIHRSYIKK